MLIDSIKMGVNDLKKRKFRTSLTALSIAVGTMLLIVMFGLGEGIEKIYTENLLKIDNFRVIQVVSREPGTNVTNEDGQLVRKPGKDKPIRVSTIEVIKKIEGVNSVVANVETQISEIKIGDKKAKQIIVVGKDTNYTIFNHALINTVKNTQRKNNTSSTEPIIAGRALGKDDSNSVLVGEFYLKKMGIENYSSLIGKDIQLKVELPKIEGQQHKKPLIIKAKIAGVVNSKYKDEARQVITSAEMAAEIMEYYSGEEDYLSKIGYTGLNVECKSIDDVKKVNDQINKELVYGTYASLDESDSIKNTFAVIKGIFIAAGVIVLLVSAIGVINTMTMTVYEKTKSIGIMKAQGASKSHVNIMFLVQSGVLGFIGGVLGTTIALAGSAVLNKIALDKLSSKGVLDSLQIDKIFRTPIWAIAAAIIFSIFVCIIAGILPARRAAKLDPVEALRYE